MQEKYKKQNQYILTYIYISNNNREINTFNGKKKKNEKISS